MTHFTLIGRPTLIFTVTRLFFLLDTIPCVRGRTADGKREPAPGSKTSSTAQETPMKDLSTVHIPIEHADMSHLNRIRAAARKHGGTVHVSRYANNAYEGAVRVTTPWNEGRDQHLARVAAIRAVVAALARPPR